MNPLLDELRELADGDEDAFRELIDLYLSTADRLLREISAALSDGNMEAAGRAAHSLKGSAGQFGAQVVMRRAIAIQEAAAQGDAGLARAHFEVLTSEHASTSAEFRTARLDP